MQILKHIDNEMNKGKIEYREVNTGIIVNKGTELEINRIIWLEDIVEKLLLKHNVEDCEVLEVFENKPIFQFKEKGHRQDENVYAGFGRTNSDRLLSIFFVYTKDKRAIIVSAREMTEKERKKYAR